MSSRSKDGSRYSSCPGKSQTWKSMNELHRSAAPQERKWDRLLDRVLLDASRRLKEQGFIRGHLVEDHTGDGRLSRSGLGQSWVCECKIQTHRRSPIRRRRGFASGPLPAGARLDLAGFDPLVVFIPCSDFARLSWAGDLKVWKVGVSGSRHISESRRSMTGSMDLAL